MKPQGSDIYLLREGRWSLLANLLLFAVKLWAGIISASAAMIADAWHTLSDSLSSLIILIGAGVSRKKADREHPFGHGRAELIAALLVGMLLAFIAFEFLLEGVARIRTQRSAEYGTIAIVVTAASLILKGALAQYALFCYRKSNYLSLKADAWHHRSDALSSLLILAGIFAGRLFWWADGVLTILVSLMIAVTAVQILRDGIRPLLGEAPDKELLNYLSDVCRRVAGFSVNVHHVHLHRYGKHLELTFHMKLPAAYSLHNAHEIVTRVEKQIKNERQIEATIHMEPQE
ncbi:MAG: cation diffusion facilitator family transporter [Candidatus Marinimicrobia bacterium]|nr:cation diffusion facilitator family transporter [Candidatus Neomarinimicrobiota bacterium]